jgi:hypothetical protein
VLHTQRANAALALRVRKQHLRCAGRAGGRGASPQLHAWWRFYCQWLLCRRVLVELAVLFDLCMCVLCALSMCDKCVLNVIHTFLLHTIYKLTLHCSRMLTQCTKSVLGSGKHALFVGHSLKPKVGVVPFSKPRDVTN